MCVCVNYFARLCDHHMHVWVSVQVWLCVLWRLPMGKTGGVLVMNSSKPAVIIELYGSNTLSVSVEEEEERKTTGLTWQLPHVSGFANDLCSRWHAAICRKSYQQNITATFMKRGSIFELSHIFWMTYKQSGSQLPQVQIVLQYNRHNGD